MNIITKKNGATINLNNKLVPSVVTSADQRITLLGEDVVNINVKSAEPIEFDIGDKINIYGRTYSLNQLPQLKKIAARKFEYSLIFEGIQYELIDAQWLLPDETVLDSFTGDLDDFINILINNANRVFPGKWAKGATPAGTETKTLAYLENNCLEVLQKLCEEYETEFEITQNNGVRTINIKRAGTTFPYTFSYGRTGGLYELTRQNVNAKNVVTRLYVYGGSNNLGSKYRYSKLCLPLKEKNASYIENTAAIEAFGIKENTKTFDKIYPKRVGEVSALGDGVRHFIDNTMNFDLNELEEDGETTKWRIDGVKPKIKFTSGGLAGYEFECSYKHETKTITIDTFSDENGMKFPSETSAAFQFKVGDKYIFTDINLPDAYKTTAEANLQAEAETYYSQYCQPQVQYGLSIDQNFIKQFAGELTIVNLFAVGDYIKVEDLDIGLVKSIRITAFTRDLLQPYKYAITIGDKVSQNITTRVISDLQKIDEVLKINNLIDPAQARRNWRSSQEVLASVFDTEGNYFSEKIKPLSIETSMLAVGAKSMQFILQNTLIEANYEGNKNAVKVTGGTLAHYTISENTRYWSLSSATTALISDSEAYYIYGKCQKGGTAGTIVFSTSQIKVEEDPNFYHFWIGVINSVDNGVRAISLTYGATTVNGRYIKTGRIESGDGKTYFDLDNNVIGGKIKFLNENNELEDVETVKLYIQYSVNGSSWHDVYNDNDKYMRQKNGASGTWTGAIPIKGVNGDDGRGITEIRSAFAYSASDTSAPFGPWYWNISSLGTRPQGYFLWMRDDIFYTDGNTSSTVARLVVEGSGGIDSEILAKINESAAVTDAMGTVISGALMSSVLMYFRELNSATVTAGISGIQGANQNSPAFWAGGTYAEALAVTTFLKKIAAGTTPSAGEYFSLAKIALLHSGAAKVGDLFVEGSGRIMLVDPTTGKPRLIFTAQNIPDLANLLGTTVASGSANNSSTSTSWVYDPNALPSPFPYKKAVSLTNSVNVTQSNSTITFNTGNVSINAVASTSTLGSTAEAYVSLLRNGTHYAGLGSAFVTVNKDNRNGSVSISIPNRAISGVSAGTYSLRLELRATDGIDSMNASMGTSTIAWEFLQANVRYFQFGIDGMMAFFSNNHIHFTETTGWDVRGKTNMPGVLASGTVNTNGGLMNEWGAKINYGQTITGGYRIFLKDMPHNRYSVQVTPHTNVTFRVSTKTSTYFEILGTGAADFVVFGSNY